MKGSLWLVFLLFLPGVFFKLEKKKLKKLLREYNQAVAEGDPYTIGKVIERLAEDNSERIAKFLLRCAMQFLEKEIHLACQRALRKIKDAKARKYLLKKMTSGKWELRIFLMETFGMDRSPEVTEGLIRNLKSKHDPVVLVAVELLGRRGDRRAVQPLIELLEEREKKRKRGEIHYQICLALAKITGKNYENASDWRKWLETGGLSNQNYGRTVVRSLPEKKGPRFFTETVVSERVVFVIDTSASMEEKDPPRGEGRTVRKSPPPPVHQLPDSRKRVERAKKQLIQVIRRLPKTTYFNVIAFNDKVYRWSVRLRQATPSNKASAIQFVSQFHAQGKTATYEALKAAFQDKRVDTIYLLSDGTPTVGPSPRSILEAVYRWNRFRKVKIYTLGFPGVDREFMIRLAEENGGKYSDIH